MPMALKPTTSRPAVAARPIRSRRLVAVRAGQDSKYFDLNDLESTVGAWDMYGQEDTKRYPDMQNEFFERAAGGGALALMTWGALGSKQANLPIQNGPQTGGENGKGGKGGRL